MGKDQAEAIAAEPAQEVDPGSDVPLPAVDAGNAFVNQHGTLAAAHEDFASALHRHLHGSPLREIDFFANPRRFALLERLIGARLRQRPLSILNAASGPFAFEHYVAPHGAAITSFDRDARLQGLHRELTARRLIAPCRFEVMDIGDFADLETFDLVLVNDLFYARHLDFFALLPALAAAVAPGGTLYFDIQDQRAGWLWRALGKDGQFRRYDLTAVRAALACSGLAVTDCAPSFGIRGGADEAGRRALWVGAGIANNVAFVAERRR